MRYRSLLSPRLGALFLLGASTLGACSAPGRPYATLSASIVGPSPADDVRADFDDIAQERFTTNGDVSVTELPAGAGATRRADGTAVRGLHLRGDGKGRWGVAYPQVELQIIVPADGPGKWTCAPTAESQALAQLRVRLNGGAAIPDSPTTGETCEIEVVTLARDEAGTVTDVEGRYTRTITAEAAGDGRWTSITGKFAMVTPK